MFSCQSRDGYTSPPAILTDEMTNRSNLPKVEQLLEYPFVDKDLGTAALRTDRLGFSRLEFLGDAIMGLSVYTVAMCRGIPKRNIDRLLSNENLDEIYRSSFAGCSSSETGDVVEALIAAVYLDGGYLRAASVTASLLLGEHRDFNFAATQDLAKTMAARQLFQLGAHVSKAVIADHLTTTSPNQPARWYSDTSKNLRTTKRLANICRGHHLEDFGIKRPPEPKRVIRALSEIKTEMKIKRALNAHLADMVDGYAALQYLNLGWDVAKNNISTLLEVSSTPRT
jgi:dsRNA-specific ribonuclease